MKRFKQLKIIFSILLLLSTSVIAQVQRSVAPRADTVKRIRFGTKQPSPAEAKKMLGIKDDMMQPVDNTDVSTKKLAGYNKLLPPGAYRTFDPAKKGREMLKPGTPGTYLQDFPNPAKNINVANNSKPAGSLNYHLTKDINAIKESSPVNYTNNIPSFAVLNNVSYFSADDGIHGRELWRSDGTAEGTYMLKDINIGEATSGLYEISEANGKLYFSAAMQNNIYEPWVSDGTEAGTHLLTDLFAAAGNSYPRFYVQVNNAVFFVAGSNFSFDNQLWKTDGTKEGTVLVKDLVTAVQSGYGITSLVVANGLLYFSFYDYANGRQLWRSDGTDAGTYQVKIINPNPWNDFNGPLQLTAYNNQLYFSADDGAGRKLWVSDGTENGTTYAPGNNDILMQPDYLFPYINTPFKKINNTLFISGFTNTEGSGLYKYDASNAAGVVLVKDLTTQEGIDFVSPVDITVVNNELYFKVISNINGWHDELWRSNGEADRTQLVKLFDAGHTTFNFYNANGALIFNKYDDELYGDELWTSDGTDAGTAIVKDIYTGRVSAYPGLFTSLNGKILFCAANKLNGRELWVTDVTSAGTMLLKDINTTSSSSSYADFFYRSSVAIGDKLVFSAYEPEFGFELYRSDGRVAGTSLVADLNPGEFGSGPFQFTSKKKDAYFVAYTPTGLGIFKMDTKTAGTKKITDLNNSSYFVSYAVADNGIVFYVMFNYELYNYQLWRSDGTAAGTYLLTSNLYFNYSLVTAGNNAFFVAGDDQNGYKLWKSNGTLQATKMVPDIGQTNVPVYPFSLFAWKNEVYFGASDNTGTGFWKSNGVQTVKLKDVFPDYSYNGYFYNGNAYCISGNSFYFAAYDNNYDQELYKTNGAAANTQLVKNINPYFGSKPGNLSDVNGKLFFTARSSDDIYLPLELWSSTGTEAGTSLVKVLPPSDYLNNFCSAGGKLFFLEKDYSYSPAFSYAVSLWNSDGTEAGTAAVDDPIVNSLSDIANLVGMDNKLFFGGYTYAYGHELYVGDANKKQFTAARVSEILSQGLKPNTAFEVALFPNPSYGNAVLQISGDAKSVSVSITDVQGKTVWQGTNKNARLINLPTERFAKGTYFVIVKNDSESKTIRFVKQ